MALQELEIEQNVKSMAWCRLHPLRQQRKFGVKEWVKKHLQSLARVLVQLVGKEATALPGIIGSIVSWLLNLLAKTVGWLAKNLRAAALAVGGILFVAARDWLDSPERKPKTE